jgi:hypothetical protein
MALIVVVESVFALLLAGAHKPYWQVLSSLPATIPGFVIATLAWRGKLRGCSAARRA